MDITPGGCLIDFQPIFDFLKSYSNIHILRPRVSRPALLYNLMVMAALYLPINFYFPPVPPSKMIIYQ
jgi:hypothetical protein